MDLNSKKSNSYLNQIKNSAEEKTQLLIENMRSNNLPINKTGRRSILEIGIGGGESLEKIKKELTKNDDLIAADIVQDLVVLAKESHNVETIATDAALLPFNDESMSAINMSAVLHEVSSYGSIVGDKKVLGPMAVKVVLDEVKRVLLPGGLFIYRDVSSPIINLFTEKTVLYRRASWGKFIEWFLQDFIYAEPCFYKNKRFDCTYNKSDQSLVLNAPIGLHRELQRHYLMFRDYIRNVIKERFGVVIHQLEWLNKEEGLKEGKISIIDLELNHLLREINTEKSVFMGREVIKMNSDDLDLLYDKAIEFYFNKIEKNNTDAGEIKKLFEQWKAREGIEYYIYGTPTEVLSLSCVSSDSSGDVLFPLSQSDIKIVPRYYYNRYLRQVIDDPEFDGKLILGLRKISRNEAKKLVKKFSKIDKNSKIIDFQYIEYKLNN